MDSEDLLYHFTPLVVVSGLGGSSVLPDHPLEVFGENPAADSNQKIQDPIGKDLHGRLQAKSNDVKIYEHLAPKVSRRKISRLVHVEFIDGVSFDTHVIILVYS